ncbi:unnamed protein product [Ranitomeya imitator]|uniref:Uncharacterized protein n=1 Tax=Ranitomeya imitator TaxID=111125 RepID=A0ABN9MEH0_9NEOB|nr:unnamed protein product [Ranitomeya imitator]
MAQRGKGGSATLWAQGGLKHCLCRMSRAHLIHLMSLSRECRELPVLTCIPNADWEARAGAESSARRRDVNVAIRKIATLLKPDKDIIQNGEHMVIKTLSTFRNYNMEFDVGKEFEEDLTGVDDRKCMRFLNYSNE